MNHNGGAESTIHGLLSMLALDAHPAVAEQARTAVIRERVGTGRCRPRTARWPAAPRGQPASGWTGESLFGGLAYVGLPAGAAPRGALGKGEPRLVLPWSTCSRAARR